MSVSLMWVGGGGGPRRRTHHRPQVPPVPVLVERGGAHRQLGHPPRHGHRALLPDLCARGRRHRVRLPYRCVNPPHTAVNPPHAAVNPPRIHRLNKP
eukprot:6716044-Pyramimonas_sp.AAC.1